MRCDEALDAIQEALDGAATAMEVAARLPRPVQDHLEGCRDCREAVHELLAIDGLLAETPAIPPMPVEMTGRIMAAIQSVPQLKAVPVVPARSAMRPLAWVLAIAMVAVGMSFFDPTPLLAGLQGWLDAGLGGLQALLQPFADLCTSVLAWTPPDQSGSLLGATIVMLAMVLGNWKLGRLQRT